MDEFLNGLYKKYAVNEDGTPKGTPEEFEHFMKNPENRNLFFDKYLSKKGSREDFFKAMGTMPESDEEIQDYEVINADFISDVKASTNPILGAAMLAKGKTLLFPEEPMVKLGEYKKKLTESVDKANGFLNRTAKYEGVTFGDTEEGVEDFKDDAKLGSVKVARDEYEGYLKKLDGLNASKFGKDWKKNAGIESERKILFKEIHELSNSKIPDNQKAGKIKSLKSRLDLLNQKIDNNPLYKEYYDTVDSYGKFYGKTDYLYKDINDLKAKADANQSVTDALAKAHDGQARGSDIGEIANNVMKQSFLTKTINWFNDEIVGGSVVAFGAIAGGDTKYSTLGVNEKINATSALILSNVSSDIKGEFSEREYIADDFEFKGLDKGDKMILDDSGQLQFVRDAEGYVKKLKPGEAKKIQSQIDADVESVLNNTKYDRSAGRAVDGAFNSFMNMAASMLGASGLMKLGASATGAFFTTSSMAVFPSYYEEAIDKYGFSGDDATFDKAASVAMGRTLVNAALETFISPMETSLLRGTVGKSTNSLERFLLKKSRLKNVLDNAVLKHPTLTGLLNSTYSTAKNILGQDFEEEVQNFSDKVIDVAIGDAEHLNLGTWNDRLNTLAATVAISAPFGLMTARQAYKNTKLTAYNMMTDIMFSDIDKSFDELDKKVSLGKITVNDAAFAKIAIERAKEKYDAIELDKDDKVPLAGVILNLEKLAQDAEWTPGINNRKKIREKVRATLDYANSYLKEHTESNDRFIYDGNNLTFVKDIIKNDKVDESKVEESVKVKDERAEIDHKIKGLIFKHTELETDSTEPPLDGNNTDRTKNIGARVEYLGVEGELKHNNNGFYVEYDDGSKAFVESGESLERTNKDLGLKIIKPNVGNINLEEEVKTNEVEEMTEKVVNEIEPPKDFKQNPPKDNDSPLDKAKFEIDLKKEEILKLEDNLNDWADLLSKEITSNPEFAEIEDGKNPFVDIIYGEGVADTRGLKGTVGSRFNASQLHKAVNSLTGKKGEKIKEIIGEKNIEEIKKLTSQWKDLAKQLNPTAIERTLKDAQKNHVKKLREEHFEKKYPGITKNVKKQQEIADKMFKVLGGNVKINIFSNPKAYEHAISNLGGNPNTKGAVDVRNRIIYVNPLKADGTTIIHEAMHLVFKDLFKKNSKDAKAMHEGIMNVLKNGTQEEQKIAAQIENFLSRYSEKDLLAGESLADLKADEFFAELVAILTNNKMKIKKPRVKAIKELLNSIIKKYTGFTLFNENATINDIIDFLNAMVNAADKGVNLDKVLNRKSIKAIVSPRSLDINVLRSQKFKANKGGSRSLVQFLKDLHKRKGEGNVRIHMFGVNALIDGKYYNPVSMVYETPRGNLQKILKDNKWTNTDKQLVQDLKSVDVVLGMATNPIEAIYHDAHSLDVFVKESMFNTKLSEVQIWERMQTAYIKNPLDSKTKRMFKTYISFQDLIRNGNPNERILFLKSLADGIDPITKPYHIEIHNNLGLDNMREFTEKMTENFVYDNRYTEGDIVIAFVPDGADSNNNIIMKDAFLPNEKINAMTLMTTDFRSQKSVVNEESFVQDIKDSLDKVNMTNVERDKAVKIVQDIARKWSALTNSTPVDFFNKYEIVDIVNKIKNASTSSDFVNNLMKDYGIFIFEDLAKSNELFNEDWNKVKEWANSNEGWNTKSLNKLNQAWDIFIKDETPIDNFLQRVFDKLRDLISILINAVNGTEIVPKSLERSFNNLLKGSTFEYNKKAPGSRFTKVQNTYNENTDGNVWVRQSNSKSNEGRTLLVQYSSELLNNLAGFDNIAEDYYEKLYKNRKGYMKSKDFWEIPTWIANAASLLRHSDVYIVRNQDEFLKFLKDAKYSNVAFSVMDVNKKLVKDALNNIDGKTILGGYVDNSYFNDSNSQWINNIEELGKLEEGEASIGLNYRHFKNTTVIPRLKLSEGCKHKCAFCDVIHNGSRVKEKTKELIDKQVVALSQLKFNLVYIDDKTYGQAPNHIYLETLNKRIKEFNPDFEGFVIQTTAKEFTKNKPLYVSDLKKYGIKYVEFGVETFNDNLLKEVNKPHRTSDVRKAFQLLRDEGIVVISNIIIGMKGETVETYQNTLDFLKDNSDIISHANIYNLALYEGTAMAEKLAVDGKISESDLNENVLEKSFHTNPKIHKDFTKAIYKFASEQLDKEVNIKSATDTNGSTADIRYQYDKNEEHKTDLAERANNHLQFDADLSLPYDYNLALQFKNLEHPINHMIGSIELIDFYPEAIELIQKERELRYQLPGREIIAKNLFENRKLIMDSYENPEMMFEAHKSEFTQKGITLFDINKLFAGIPIDKPLNEYAAEKAERLEKFREVAKQAGFTGEEINSNIALMEDMAKAWSNKTGRTHEEFFSDVLADFEFELSQSPINENIDSTSTPKSKASKVRKSIWGTIKKTLGYIKRSKFDKLKDPSPLDEDKALEETKEGQEFKKKNDAVIRGSRRLTLDGRYIIKLTSNANVSTPMHEMAHIYENFLSEKDRAIILKHFGDTVWNTGTSEKFARGFEEFLREGPITDNVDSIRAFTNFKNWLRELFKLGLTYDDQRVYINDNMRSIYSKMFNSNIEPITKITQDTNTLTTKYDNGTSAQNIKTLKTIMNTISENPDTAYQSTTMLKIAESVIKKGFYKLETARELMHKGFKILYETRADGMSDNTGLSVEQATGIYVAIQNLLKDKTSKVRQINKMIDAGLNVDELKVQLENIKSDIKLMTELLLVYNSSQGKNLVHLRHDLKILKVENLDIIELMKETDAIKSEQGKSRLSLEVREEVTRKVNKIKDLEEQLRKLMDEESDESIERYEEIVKEHYDNMFTQPLFKNIFNSLKDFNRTELKDKYDENARKINEYFKVNPEELFDSNETINIDWYLYEQMVIASKLNEGSIDTIKDMVNYLSAEMPSITENYLKDMILAVANTKEEVVKKAKSSMTMIRRESKLIQEIETLLNGYVEQPNGTVTLRKKSTTSIDALKGILTDLSSMVTKYEYLGDTSNPFFNDVLKSISELGTMYDNLTVNGTKINELTKNDLLIMMETFKNLKATRAEYFANNPKVKKDKSDEQKELEKRRRLLDSLNKLNEALRTNLAYQPSTISEDSERVKDIKAEITKLREELNTRHLPFKYRHMLDGLETDIQLINDIYNRVGNKNIVESSDEFKMLQDKYNVNKKPKNILLTDPAVVKLQLEIKHRKNEIMRMLKNEEEDSWIKDLAELSRFFKGLKLAADYSYMWYQAGKLVFSNKDNIIDFFSGRAIYRTVKGSVKANYYEQELNKILSDPKYYEALAYGLEIGGIIGDNLEEELLMYSRMEKARGIGKGLKWLRKFSERGYNIHMVTARLKAYKSLSENLYDDEALKEIAEHVNTSSGAAKQFVKGSHNESFNKVLEVFQIGFIAPRLYASEFKSISESFLLTDIYKHFNEAYDTNYRNFLKSGEKVWERRAEANLDLMKALRIKMFSNVKMLFGQLGLTALSAALTMSFGSDDSKDKVFDIFSSQFLKTDLNGKIYTLNPRISYYRFLGKMVAKLYEKLFKVSLNDSKRWKNQDFGDLFAEFLQYRYNPIVALVNNIAYDETWSGRPFTKNQKLQRIGAAILPIPLEDLIKTLEDDYYQGKGFTDIGLDVGLSILTSLAGINNYENTNQVAKVAKDSVGFRYRTNYPSGMKKEDDRVRALFKNEAITRFNHEVSKMKEDKSKKITKGRLHRLKMKIEREVAKEMKKDGRY